MIEEAQDRKEMGIKVAGAMRDATLLTVELMKEARDNGTRLQDDEMKNIWRRWRDFFMHEYDGARDLPF